MSELSCRHDLQLESSGVATFTLVKHASLVLTWACRRKFFPGAELTLVIRELRHEGKVRALLPCPQSKGGIKTEVTKGFLALTATQNLMDVLLQYGCVKHHKLGARRITVSREFKRRRRLEAAALERSSLPIKC
ncbi:hypothetical protein PoB_005015800 [Plakobranchus ocellatus]|uniref:Uncharacterized protein n=1 Tax=Plakobranchus ocellatus TaxID=259542 RepID=A0AAV4BXX1_9GAST|nr:hypothetical protein PoB_005015800 [Plakobranchus ocellatus]